MTGLNFAAEGGGVEEYTAKVPPGVIEVERKGRRQVMIGLDLI